MPAADAVHRGRVVADASSISELLNTAWAAHELTAEHAIYLTKDGRISIAGLNAGNVATVARAIHAVTDGKAIGSG